MGRTKTYKKAIEKIIDNFDFKKVYKIMVACDWKWDSDKGPEQPTVPGMQRLARHLLTSICEDPEYGANNDSSVVATGGFKATRWEDCLSLEFIVDVVEVFDVQMPGLKVVVPKEREDNLIIE